MFDKKIKNENLFVTFLATCDIKYIGNGRCNMDKSNEHIAICYKRGIDEAINVLNNTSYGYYSWHVDPMHSGETMVIKETPLSYFYEDLGKYIKVNELKQMTKELNDKCIVNPVSEDAVVLYGIKLYKLFKEKGYPTEEVREIVKDEVANYIEQLSEYETIAKSEKESIIKDAGNNMRDKALYLIRTKNESL